MNLHQQDAQNQQGLGEQTARMNRQNGVGQVVANDALREIAGRLKRLSYQDMVTLASNINARLPLMTAELPLVLLQVAEALEKA